MLNYPNIDPVLLQIGPLQIGSLQVGPLQIHWYGIMYLIGFGMALWLGNRRLRHNKIFTPEQLSDLIFYAAIGIVLGGRIGYILFYDLASYVAEPLNMLKIWQGGMSFHGGFVGVLVAAWLYARKLNLPFFAVTDFIAPLIPFGLGAGRIGNFINGELWGRYTDLPWGMVFPHIDNISRHPSQLYQALLEGLLLFIILWLFSKRPRPIMAVSGLFLVCYGLFRFLIEFVREPDQQIGFIAFDWMTMGQLLTIPMLIVGIVLIKLAYRRMDFITDEQ